MSRAIEDLEDDVERMARSFLLAAHDAGLSVSVTSTRRTKDEQVAYYAQGRGMLELVNLLRKVAAFKPIPEAENHIISKCDGVNKMSFHQTGRAFDVVLLNKFGTPIWRPAGMLGEYKLLGKIAKEHALQWGGDFQPIDPVTGIGWDPYHLQA